MLSWVEYEKSFIISGSEKTVHACSLSWVFFGRWLDRLDTSWKFFRDAFIVEGTMSHVATHALEKLLFLKILIIFEQYALICMFSVLN